MAPLIVITGPTGSGKSRLALELAEKHSGEIICADSRTVYRGMDIGTAKPTADEKARVPHHLLDLVEPGERFTAHEFQSHATRAIADIRSRGRVPFLVGGTGLYIDSVILDYEWPEQKSTKTYDNLSVNDLQTMLKSQHIQLPENKNNKRHLVNALRRQNAPKKRVAPLENTCVVAITTDTHELEKRLRARAEAMFASGVIDEARRLGDRYGWDSEAMTGNIYPILRRVIEGELTEAEAIELFIIKDRQFAKRQLTWLKRHDFVRWLNLHDAQRFIHRCLEGGSSL